LVIRGGQSIYKPSEASLLFRQPQKMKDQDKTKKQLIDQLVELRQRIGKLEKTETELKRAEELLEKERETFFPILHKAPYGVILIDKEGSFIYINPSFTHITGYTLEDVLSGKDWFHRVNPFPRYRQEIMDSWKKDVIQQGTDRVFSVVCKEGEIKEIEFKPTLLDDGTIIVIFSDITERKRSEEALRESEEKCHSVVEHANQGILIAQEGMIRFSNPKISEISGYSQEELSSKPFTEFIYPDDREIVVENHLKRLQGIELPHIYDFRILDKEANIKWLEINVALINWEGKPATLDFLTDITERKRTEEEVNTLQEQFRHSQKMEAIGRLAGGIAHDFNNLLTIIKGYSQLSLQELKEDNPLRGNIEEIKKASEKATDLTRQLLNFSRSQMMEMRVIDLNNIVRNLDKMLRRVIGKDVELITCLADDLGRGKADPGQIDQIIMNLVVNAKDAMPSGRKLAIETANVELDEVYARSHIGVKPGRYVMLLVCDTGMGMAPEVKKKVFEPFFTTKEKDKGTGLGLSTVYGIVKQSAGDIWVYSEPGYGTTFKIYLPRVDEPQDIVEVKEERVEEGLPLGDETILVVENDEEVRKITGRILRMQGYRVLEASNEDDAFQICNKHDVPIHLMVTDVVMPKMHGPELAKRASSLYSEMKVIYMSGHVENVISHDGVLEKGMENLQKPFTINDLARKVREVLDK
jgi:two-component system, cell cycle sensor histidine kinase and response regulator CckA